MKKQITITKAIVEVATGRMTAGEAADAVIKGTTKVAGKLAADPRWTAWTPGQQVLAAVIEQAREDLEHGNETDFSAESLASLGTVVPQVKPALTAVFDKVGWPLLAKQKLTLTEMISYLSDTAKEQESDEPDVTREQVMHLEGLLNMLDEVMDAAEKDGYPVVFLTEEDPMLYQCQDCGKEWTEAQLKEIPEEHYDERVGPGDEEPGGECPECGALCHAMDEECDDCGVKVTSLIGCPDGAEICRACFDGGRH